MPRKANVVPENSSSRNSRLVETQNACTYVWQHFAYDDACTANTRVPRHVEHALSRIQSFRLSIRTDHVTTCLILESIILRGKYTVKLFVKSIKLILNACFYTLRIIMLFHKTLVNHRVPFLDYTCENKKPLANSTPGLRINKHI